MAKKIQNPVDLYAYDMEKRLSYPLLCGVVEAGRGPLAGDVYAAAVILSPEQLPKGLNDSKKLTEKKREQLFPQIQEMAVAYCIATASVEEIATYNILGATMLASSELLLVCLCSRIMFWWMEIGCRCFLLQQKPL